MSRLSRTSVAVLLTPAALALVACGDDGTAGADERPTVVVTTDVLGDVVADLVGDGANVEVVMPSGSSPHDFQASPRQVAAMRAADALVVNGAGFEEGLSDPIEAAEHDGVPTFAAIEAVDAIELGEEGDDHTDEPGDDTTAGADDDHGDEGTDPHFFTDPARMATAAEAIAGFLVDEVPALDTPAFADRVDATVARLRELDGQVEQILADIPADARTLITNHEVFGYFAERYGFEVIGAVIPAGTTQAEPSAAQLDALARTIEARAVPAIFVETSSPTRLAEALAAEVGHVALVELFTESLGPEGSGAETFADMMLTNAERIAEALGG
jgi:zinc/manganese transport system substrate-binding protein